jgi:hypothetical protein
MIYILLLENRKYYIGKTSNPKFRIENHFENNCIEWTKIHKPIKLLKIIANTDDEDRYTIKYMNKYGIDNVRGGSYISITLNDHVKNNLIKINNTCFKCGKKGHLSKDCNYDDDNYSYDDEKNNNDSDNVSDNDNNDNNDSDNDEKYLNHICFKCGRKGHYASSCYASKHIKGFMLNE